MAWQVSNTLDGRFCLEALQKALRGGCPEIFNSDQGVQFTSQPFVAALTQANIRISRDGRGRYLDNIFVERLWRTVKYEEVYLKKHETVPDLLEGLRSYFLLLYNYERPHQHLGYRTPAELYQESAKEG